MQFTFYLYITGWTHIRIQQKLYRERLQKFQSHLKYMTPSGYHALPLFPEQYLTQPLDHFDPIVQVSNVETLRTRHSSVELC